MAGGSWTTGSKVRPGLYINFNEAAIAQISGGQRGVVAMPLHSFDTVNGTAQRKKVYVIDNETDAADLFGADYIQPIKFALQAGAKEVLVYVMPEFDAATYAQDNIDMRNAIEAYQYNVFTFDRENLGVVSGLTAAADTTTATQLNVDAGVATLLQTDGSHKSYSVAAATFDTGAVASTTYYLDLDPDGTFSWGTAHSLTDDYVPVAEADTDSVGDILAVRDVRLLANAEQDNVLAWTQTNKSEGKHFMSVFGGNTVDDQDPTVGDARSVRLADDYAANLIVGVDIDSVEHSSGAYAPFIAGLIAGTAINDSITYATPPVDDVTRRLRNSEIKTSLQSGSLVLFHDGEKVKVEQGIATSTEKIRSVRARQAVATDITQTASDSYIGKIDNNRDGQMSLISAIRSYLERLESNSVLILGEDPVVLDPQYSSTGDKVYLLVNYTEVDSMEHIYLTINL